MTTSLKSILQKAWSEETAYNNDWDSTLIEKNQCGHTSLIVHYVTGAKIFFLAKENHFYNVLNGEIIDLTKEQFNYPLDYSTGIEVPSLSLRVHPDTSERFGIVVGNILKNILHGI